MIPLIVIMIGAFMIFGGGTDDDHGCITLIAGLFLICGGCLAI